MSLPNPHSPFFYLGKVNALIQYKQILISKHIHSEEEESFLALSHTLGSGGWGQKVPIPKDIHNQPVNTR